MKITKRDAKLLIVLLGALVFIGLYQFVNNKIVEQTNAVKAEIAQLQPQADELELHYQNLDIYKDSIEKNSKEVMNIMMSLPADVKEEDFLSYLLALEAAQTITIDSVTFDPATLFAQFEATYKNGVQDEVAMVSAYEHHTMMSAQMNYGQVKNVLRYIYSDAYRTVVNSATLTYHSESGGLTANFDIVKYSMDWPMGEYKPLPVPQTGIGVRDLFGTGAVVAEP